MPVLAEPVDAGVAAGFRPLRAEAVEQSEWDDFESGFLADREVWLMGHAGDREAADAHRGGWLGGHRGLLGFAYVTFGRPL
ncbi:MAG TPA: hypothetical protein VFU12_01405 [Glycomyces sp.]|nr:hypothetical protein [Glycomyces sp.]